MADAVFQLVSLGIVAAAFAAGGAWSGVRYALRALRRDVDELEGRVGALEHRVDAHDALLAGIPRPGRL